MCLSYTHIINIIFRSFCRVGLTTPTDNKLTKDTATGIEWLDLTETTGLSVNEIVNGVGNNWYQQFRYATRDEFIELANNIFSQGGVLIDTVFEVMNMLGITNNSDNGCLKGWQAIGFVDPFAGHPLQSDRGYISKSSGCTIPTTVSSNFIEDAGDDFDTRSPYIGNYLVKVVPLPAAAWLFGSGLLGLIGVARRKANQLIIPL